MLILPSKGTIFPLMHLSKPVNVTLNTKSIKASNCGEKQNIPSLKRYIRSFDYINHSYVNSFICIFTNSYPPYLYCQTDLTFLQQSLLPKQKRL